MIRAIESITADVNGSEADLRATSKRSMVENAVYRYKARHRAGDAGSNVVRGTRVDITTEIGVATDTQQRLDHALI